MIERPIIFSAPMVRAILEGRKTQTRRVVKPQPADDQWIEECAGGGWMVVGDGEPTCATGVWDTREGAYQRQINFPFAPGMRLWVRETFMHEPADYCWEASVSIPCRPASTVYRADFPDSKPGEGWKPSIHMPRSLSRILLEVTGVRVERLQSISYADAIAEGIPSVPGRPDILHAELWEQIHGPGAWDANPYVWVVEFKRIEP